MTGFVRRRPAARAACALLIALSLAACAIPGGTGSPAAPGSASAAASVTALPTPTPAAAVPSPGLPYDTATILIAMRESRRPGGVPDLVETDAIAGAVAAQLWTYDGMPWAVLSIGGACGSSGVCTLDVTGTAAGGGSDLYSFRIEPEAGQAALVEQDLHGYPPELEAELDAVARAEVDPARLTGLQLVGTQWMAPPLAGRFRLAYRSGGEEGSPGLDIVVDLPTATVLEISEVS